MLISHQSLISVIVPVYNVEQYLDRCVESIVNQTYSNIEIIIVDDGSTDGSPAKCDAWAERDPRIKVIHKENGGGAQARNVGLDVASGEYITFVDSDDAMHSQMYRRLLSAVEISGADIAECGFVTEENDLPESVSGDVEIIGEYNAVQALEQNIDDKILRQLIWNKIYAKDVLHDVRFVEGRVIDDEFFTYRALGNAKKCVVIPDKLYYYRQHDNSVMHKTYSLKRLDDIDAKCARQQYLEDHFPSLISKGRVSIVGSCIFQGQMTLIHLKGEEKNKAFEIFRSTVKKYKVGRADVSDLPLKRKVWLLMARYNLKLTCRIKNLLKLGF